jgi:hypothetical protein
MLDLGRERLWPTVSTIPSVAKPAQVAHRVWRGGGTDQTWTASSALAIQRPSREIVQS